MTQTTFVLAHHGSGSTEAVDVDIRQLHDGMQRIRGPRCGLEVSKPFYDRRRMVPILGRSLPDKSAVFTRAAHAPVSAVTIISHEPASAPQEQTNPSLQASNVHGAVCRIRPELVSVLVLSPPISGEENSTCGQDRTHSGLSDLPRREPGSVSQPSERAQNRSLSHSETTPHKFNMHRIRGFHQMLMRCPPNCPDFLLVLVLAIL